MKSILRKWLPVALCCVPGVAVAGVVGIGLAAGGAALGSSFGGPLGLALIGLAVLACPVSMGLMMLRQRGSSEVSSRIGVPTPEMADCCLPGQVMPVSEAGASGEWLAALRAQREALERELAELLPQ